MSFRTKTIIGIAAIEAIFLIILVFSSLNLLESSNKKEIEQRALDTVEILSSMVKDAVISNDLASLEAVTSEIIERDKIAYIQIWGGGHLLSEKFSLGFEASKSTDVSINSVDDGVFDIDAKIEEAGYDFGSVKIGVIVSELGTLIAQARKQLGTIAFIEMILVAVFSYVLGTYLTKSLAKLRLAAQKITKGDTNVSVDVIGQDEISETVTAFNFMSTSLAANVESLNQALKKSKEDKVLAEKRLAQTNALLDITIDGILSVDKEGIIQEVNLAACKLFGKDSSNLIGQNILESLKVAKGNTVFLKKQTLEPCQNKALILSLENGHQRPIELSISYVEDDQHESYIVLIRDMTEQLAIKKEIEDKNAIHKAIIHSSLDAIISIDSAGLIQEFGPSAQSLLGFTAEEVYGKRLEDTIIPHTMRAAHSHKMAHPTQDKTKSILSKRIEVEALHKYGHLIPIEMVVAPIEVNGARLFTAFIRDISERLDHEQEMKDALAQAKAGSEEKSRFLATMSHEIRSPLNAVLGSLDLLRDTQLSPEQRLYTKTSKDAGRALLSLINDILDFSKIEAGLLELDLHTFSIEDMLDQIMQMAYPKAKDKGLELVYVLDKDIPAETLGDVVRLRQVIINLVDNAIKFSHCGTIQILVSMKNDSQQAAKLHVEVIDPGVGVPIEKRKDLFEEFTQVDASHSTKYGGTGLGLAICRRIVELMGGQIGIDMEYQHGSRFYFDVLLENATQADSVNTSGDVLKSIAVLHYDPVFSKAVKDQLCLYGLDVEGYRDISTLLEAEHRSRKDIILLDEHSLDLNRMGSLEKIKLNCLKEQGQLVLLKSELRHNSVNLQLIDLQILKPLSRAKLLALAGLGADDKLSIQVNAKSFEANVRTGAKILLAEDSPANQMVATTMLRQAGYIVDVANNGQEAVDAVDLEEYDLVLMDMRMPDIDGLSATRLIRSNPDHKDLPIVALTANAQQEDVENCMNAGMNAYLSKPINKCKLLESINTFLSLSLEDNKSDKVQDDQAVTRLIESSTKETAALFSNETLKALGEETSWDVLPAIVENFIDDCQQRILRIKDHLSDLDLIVIGDEAHTIKSSSALFGLTKMHHLAKQLETACNDQKQDAVSDLIVSLISISQPSLDVLNESIKDLNS